MNARLVFAAVLCVLASASVHAEGDAEQGRDVFFAECIGCHAMACNRAGPRLGGVIGRPAASIDDFDYTEGLKESGIIWTVETLDRFLADPRTLVPGTPMWLKVEDPAERQDLIAFLQSGDTSFDLCG